MTRIPRYSIATLLAASLLPVAAGARPGATSAQEPPLAAIVAPGPTATPRCSRTGRGGSSSRALPGDTDPAVAPDGRRIAFVSMRDGNEEIYVADARTGEVRRLTHDARARPPAGLGAARPQHRLAERAAGRGRSRTSCGTTGRESVSSPEAPATTPIRPGRRTQLESRSRRPGAARASSGQSRRPAASPTRSRETQGRVRAPAWAPGGRRLAFALESGSDSDIWTLELADGSTRKLTRGAGRDSRPDWSPRGDAHRLRARDRRALLDLGRRRGRRSRPPDRRPDGLADPDWAPTDRSLVPRPDEHSPTSTSAHRPI